MITPITLGDVPSFFDHSSWMSTFAARGHGVNVALSASSNACFAVLPDPASSRSAAAAPKNIRGIALGAVVDGTLMTRRAVWSMTNARGSNSRPFGRLMRPAMPRSTSVPSRFASAEISAHFSAVTSAGRPSMQTAILPLSSTSFRSSRPNFFDTSPWPTKTSGGLTCMSANVPSDDQSVP